LSGRNHRKGVTKWKLKRDNLDFKKEEKHREGQTESGLKKGEWKRLPRASMEQ